MLAFVSCSAPWKESLREPVSVGNPDWIPVPGGHCESSALVNALRYSGWDVAEHQVIGGGGALSFVFIDGDFPFIGARNTDMRERFAEASGIDLHAVVPSSPGADWDKIAALLASDVPVCLRVDMRFLPYRYGGRNGPSWMSFGAHWITLYSLDPVRGVARVSDTEYRDMQEVSLRDLHRARTSATKNFPPKAEYCYVDRVPAGSPLSPMPAPAQRLVESSFRTVLSNYQGGALDGLSRFGESIASLSAWEAKKYLLGPVLEYLAGNIEDHGTGGASFRMPYRDFLSWAAESGLCSDELLSALDGSIARWHDLSAAFRAEAAGAKRMDSAEREAARGRLREASDSLYQAERAFFDVLSRSQ